MKELLFVNYGHTPILYRKNIIYYIIHYHMIFTIFNVSSKYI